MTKSTAKEKTPSATVAPMSAPKFDPANIKVKRLVTLPLRKWTESEPAYLRIDGAIFTGKEIKQTVKEGETVTKEKPADLANCTDLETGQQVQVIIGAVLRSTLEDEYPNDGYVGKCFMFIQQPKGAGKRYKTYHVSEIEVG